MPIHTILILLAMVILSVACFALGYDISREKAEKAEQLLWNRLDWEAQHRFELSQWVEEKWPSEYAAYQLGHKDGYQQGVIQSPELEEQDA